MKVVLPSMESLQKVSAKTIKFFEKDEVKHVPFGASFLFVSVDILFVIIVSSDELLLTLLSKRYVNFMLAAFGIL